MEKKTCRFHPNGCVDDGIHKMTCCANCWNSEHALKKKADLGYCGLACECHSANLPTETVKSTHPSGTNYEALRTRINELLPDRKKLEFGCEVRWRKNNYVFLREAPRISAVVCHLHGANQVRYIDPRDEYFSVLGKPLTIEDVLRATALVTESKNHPFWYGIDDIGRIVCISGYGAGDYCELTSIKFDLTKPLSAPENDAACGAVLRLLTV